jgi:hypothetical protein
MRFVVSQDLLGASPTDPGGATPATDPSLLVLNAEHPLGPTAENRNVSLNEEISEMVCARTLSDGSLRWITPIRFGPDFEDECQAAGGESYGPEAAVLGTLDTSGDPVGIRRVVTDGTSSTNVAQSGATVR